jgi:hypothetical protein
MGRRIDTLRRDGTVLHRLLEDVGPEATRAGDVRFVSRFPTPVDGELRA